MENKGIKQGKRRWIIASIISSVLTAAVVLVVGCALFFGAKLCAEQTDSDPEIFYVEISDDPGQANIQIRKADQIILTESKKDMPNTDHAVTLQDFKRGLQAVKDLDKRKCFVFPTYGQFEWIKNIVQNKNISASTEVKMVDKTAARDPIPPELMHLAVGKDIADFCEGLDSYWLVDSVDPDAGSNSQTTPRMKRGIEISIGVRIGRLKITLKIRIRRRR